MDDAVDGRSLRRRDVLKKSAAAGVVAWTTPLIVSSRVLAGGAGTCPEPGPCAGTFLVRFEERNSTCFGDVPPGTAHDECRTVICSTYGGIPTAGCSYVEEASVGGDITLRLAPGFQVARVFVKQGEGCFTSGFASGANCDWVVSPGGFSNAYVFICGPVVGGLNPCPSAEAMVAPQGELQVEETTTTTVAEAPAEPATEEQVEAPQEAPTDVVEPAATTTTTTAPPDTTTTTTTTTSTTTTSTTTTEPPG